MRMCFIFWGLIIANCEQSSAALNVDNIQQDDAEWASSYESINTILKFNEISTCFPPSNQHTAH